MKFLYHLIPHNSNSAVFKIIEYFQTPILFTIIFYFFNFREGMHPYTKP